MLLYTLFLTLMATFGWSAMTPLCTPVSSSRCVLTFTNFQAPQREPVSTVYKALATTTFFIVDCDHCTVKNIDANPIPTGRFTTKITRDVLQITKIACMPQSTAITRREYRGYGPAKEIRAARVDNSHQLIKRSMQQISDKLAQLIDPDNSKLNVLAYNIIKQLHSAIFALDLINSGFDLPQLCRDLRDPNMQLQMIGASLIPQQVADIVCFASVYGFDLHTTNADLLSDLAAAIYAVQVGSQFTTDLHQLCSVLDLSAGPALGFDAPGIRRLICPWNVTSSMTTTEFTSTTTPDFTITTTSNIVVGPPLSTGDVGTVGTIGTGGFPGTAATVGSGPYTNTTQYPGTAGTILGTGSGATDYPNTTWYGNRLPPNPTASIYYPVWTTSTVTSEATSQ